MGFARTLAVFLAWLLAPVAFVIVPGLVSPDFLPDVRLAVLGGWFALVFPHPWFHDLDGARLFTNEFALGVAVFQWLAVGTLFSIAARRHPLHRVLWLAPLAIVGTGLVVAGIALLAPVDVRPRLL